MRQWVHHSNNMPAANPMSPSHHSPYQGALAHPDISVPRKLPSGPHNEIHQEKNKIEISNFKRKNQNTRYNNKNDVAKMRPSLILRDEEVDVSFSEWPLLTWRVEKHFIQLQK